MGSELVIEDTPGGGTTMVIALDVAGGIDAPLAPEVGMARG
jgi:hypothetical protein